MRKLIWVASGLLFGLICACNKGRSYGPPGSSLVGGRVCFERQSLGGKWERVGLVTADGHPAVRGQAASGEWYFPPGRVRVVPNCEASQ